MILEKGNMWDAFGKGIFMVTTNPIIKHDGGVVMGRGIALEAKTRFPDLPYLFGARLNENKGVPFVDYIAHFNHVPIWYFMVKSHWNRPADLKIIENSVKDLLTCIIENENDLRFDLNFPGIGNGKLHREDVLPLLQSLPDNVHVWEYDK